MKSNGNYDWKFSTIGGVTRVKITTGEDIAHLDELDQKLWTVLSCPVNGLEMPQKTLSLIDSDHDGKIHVGEVVAAAKWLTSVLKDPEVLVAGGENLALDAFNEENETGSTLLSCARRILETAGLDKDSVSIDEAESYLEMVSKRPFNGDGVVVPASAGEDGELRQTIADIVATQGGVTDRSGEAGADSDKLEAFYTAVAEHVAWLDAGKADSGNIFPYGEDTVAALACVEHLKAKIDDYFLRCKLAAFNGEAAGLNVSSERICQVGAKNLSDCVEEIAEYPIANVSASRVLNLAEGINPVWTGEVDRLRSLVLKDGEDCLTEEKWLSVQESFGAYRSWMASKKGCSVESLGEERLRAVLAADRKAAVAELITADKALEESVANVESVSKLLFLHRDFYTFLRNFVTFDDFYSAVDGHTKAIFQAGSLFIDQRSTDLCIKVEDMGKQGDMAGLSGMFILYCACESRVKKQTMDIAAILTEGQISSLRVGQNAVFYDRQGEEWDAVVTKIVSNPISVTQAFMSPYRKFADTISERLKKSMADKEDKVMSDMAGKASSLAVPSAEGADAAAAAPKQGFDVTKISILVAAFGMAFSCVTLALKALFKPWYTIFLVIAALVVCISGPSMAITWIKLRKRNLGPILNANGWAINSKILVNSRFGSYFTHLVRLPKIKMDDPLSDKTPLWKKIHLWLILILVLAGAAWLICPAEKRPFCRKAESCETAAAPQCEQAPADTTIFIEE
ncbi:MAG: hypothetical protein ACI399_06520 [Candidatus Cryptobacteroides sp.]